MFTGHVDTFCVCGIAVAIANGNHSSCTPGGIGQPPKVATLLHLAQLLLPVPMTTAAPTANASDMEAQAAAAATDTEARAAAAAAEA